ncbi:Dabb family protein [Novosphingobium sp. G106]|uniref:Dabb family protein n=1 Tax=Novosphingobium sp. G106 TaxID=2849500 RepID=UPI001C2CDB12|nr:Dabb family protein [Novosphingobium sp. G106]MBV1686436.1 Dabb family protein [Novosphingobium sp. G106]
MITHTVFFWLKNADSIEDRDKLIAGVRGLAAIEGVRSLVVGVPAKSGDREVLDKSYSVSEILTFDSVEDEAIYQVHPLHKQFIADHSHLWSNVTVYDIEAV